MFVGPRPTGAPLEVAVVTDADGEAIIHAMPARAKFLKGRRNEQSNRAKKLEAFERWADTVDADDLVELDTTALKALRELSEQRTAVEAQLIEAVRRARADHRSWSEILWVG